MIYFEDIEIGTIIELGPYEVTREEVIAFASAYDPQPFHLDDEAAAKTHFGRLSASGWHTCAMTMRMLVDSWQGKEPQASLGSPGIDQLRWLKPVFPGDTLTGSSELIEKRLSKSRPEMGFTKGRVSVTNQHGVEVLTMHTNGIMATRPKDG